MESDLTQSITNNLFTVNNLWMMVATALVFIMHLGFASLEAGLTQSKNTVNILYKNSVIPAIGLLTYALWGFNLMYPGGDFAGAFIGELIHNPKDLKRALRSAFGSFIGFLASTTMKLFASLIFLVFYLY